MFAHTAHTQCSSALNYIILNTPLGRNAIVRRSVSNINTVEVHNMTKLRSEYDDSVKILSHTIDPHTFAFI